MSTPLNYEDLNTVCADLSAHNHLREPAAEQIKVQLQKWVMKDAHCSSNLHHFDALVRNAHTRQLIMVFLASKSTYQRSKEIYDLPNLLSTKLHWRFSARTHPHHSKVFSFHQRTKLWCTLGGMCIHFVMGNNENAHASDSFLDLLASWWHWM